MPIISRTKKGEYSTAPEGLHNSVCCDVIDKGLVQTEWGEKYQVQIRWQLEEIDPEANPPRPFLVMATYTNSLHEKSRLRPMLEAWRGKKFTAEELDGFDLEKLLGAPCQVQVVHAITNKGTYANVQAVVPAAKGSTKLRVSADYIRVCEREKRAQLENEPDVFEAEDSDVPF